MSNTNFRTFHQMGSAINSVVRQATGRDNVQNIDMDYVTVAQNKRLMEEIITGNPASFVTNIVGPLDYLRAQINPVQDLHGYENPWPAGGGKNLFPLTVAGVKEFNTSGTWDGNEYTATTGVKFKIVSHDGISIDEIIVNGTATSDTGFNLLNQTNAAAIDGTKTYFVSGCPSGGGSSKYRICIYSRTDGSTANRVTNDYGSGSALYSESIIFWGVITIFNGNTVSNLSFHPMVEIGNSATSYAPYSNICPISGWAGANVTRTGGNVYITENSVDGKFIAADGTITANDDFLYTDLIPINAFDKIYVKSTNPGNIARYTRVHGYDANGAWVQQVNATQIQVNSTAEYSFAIPLGITYIRISIAKSLTDVSFDMGNVYSISFPSSAGTVYGGELTVNKDGTGTLVVDRAMLDLGSVNWGVSVANDAFLSSYAPSGIKIPASQLQKTITICSIYSTSAVTGQADFSLSIPPSGKVKIYDSRFNLDTGAFKTAMNGVVIVYPIATPVTYQLSELEVIETLKGINNIWADTGDVTVMYKNYEEVI